MLRRACDSAPRLDPAKPLARGLLFLGGPNLAPTIGSGAMHILLGTDGSSYALAAARFLSTLLHPEVRAHVDLVTVLDPEGVDAPTPRRGPRP